MVDTNTADHVAILPCANTSQQRMSADRGHARDDDAGVLPTF